MRHDTRERFQYIGVLSSIQLPLDGGAVLAEFTWYFRIWLHSIARDNMQSTFQLRQIFVRFLVAIILWLLLWWALAPIFVVINTIYLFFTLTKSLSRSPSAGLLRLISSHIWFFGLTERMTQMANQSWISFIHLVTNKISASRCIALIGADLNAPKILRNPVSEIFEFHLSTDRLVCGTKLDLHIQILVAHTKCRAAS